MPTTRTLTVNYGSNTLTVNPPILTVPNQENADVVWNARGRVESIQGFQFPSDWPYGDPTPTNADKTQWHVEYTNTDSQTTTYKYDVTAVVNQGVGTQTLDPEIVNAGTGGGR